MFLSTLFPFSIVLSLSINPATSTSSCAKKSVTTTINKFGSNGPFCPGDLIFDEQFNDFNLSLWTQVENENKNRYFNIYSKNPNNSFVKDGILHIRPTPTFNKESKPVGSARLNTQNAFAFKFGKVEVRARLPIGDWMQPAIWLMPEKNLYGKWPTSGEIDLMESWGNQNMTLRGEKLGVNQVVSTIHFGINDTIRAHFGQSKDSPKDGGFHRDFHKYQLEWSEDEFSFRIDDQLLKTIKVGEGFFKMGKFDKIKPPVKNIWGDAKRNAPFDQEFHIIINVSIGGMAWFPDKAKYTNAKPWRNWEKFDRALDKFWKSRSKWLPSWEKSQGLEVDYIRIWAL